MRVLVTGASGLLGTELRKQIGAAGSDMGIVPESIMRAEVFYTDRKDLDIADRESTLVFLADHRFDVIINCAAMTNVDACESAPDVAMRANAIGVRNLAEVAGIHGAKLVHISTDYVFSGEASAPYREWDACGPRTVYGLSKLLGERYAASFCARYFIVRTSWLYGYTGKHFVGTVLTKIREGVPLKVVNDQRGSPTNAEDLAHHILKIACSEEYGVFHCSGGGECTWYELAAETARLLELPYDLSPCTSREFPRLAHRPVYSVMDNMMLRCTVGDGMRHWKEALASYIRRYKMKF